MKPEMILQADVLDILFEHRNKEYGAYALRKEYARRLFHSLSGVLFVLLTGFVFLYWNNNRPKKNDDGLYNPAVDSVKLISIPVDPPPPLATAVKPPPPVKTIAFPPPRIVPDIEKPKPIATIDDRERALTSDHTTDGPPISTETILPPIKKGNGDPKPEQAVVAEPPVLETAEVHPEFPGGQSAWLRFLQKNLRHPDVNDENGSAWKFRVVIRFIVNEDGSLSGLEILESGGTEFDKEVLRVLNKSPKWVAGSNKGKKVKVYHKQPVIFMYEKDE